MEHVQIASKTSGTIGIMTIPYSRLWLRSEKSSVLILNVMPLLQETEPDRHLARDKG